MKRPMVHYRMQLEKTNDPNTSSPAKLYLYDDISKYGSFNWETWDYEESSTSAAHFQKLLNEAGANTPIELYINSNGGDVDQGTAIYNMLKRHPGKVTGYVDGACHSIAFTIFQACDERVMGEGTSAIIHDMWMHVTGNAADLRKAADDLDVMMESCIHLFMQRAKHLTEKDLRELMHQETVLTPEKAMYYGFCDRIGSGTKEEPKVKEREDHEEELKQNLAVLAKEVVNIKRHQENLKEFMQYAFTKSQALNPKQDGFNAFFED